MKILDTEISDKAAMQIEAVCESLQRPVRYLPAEDPQNGAGADDARSGDPTEYYTVYLPSGLARRMFEANILYELYHIRQFETGFPTLGYKDSPLFSEDRDFVGELGSLIFTAVLDLDVYDSLCKCRYNDAVRWFAGNIYEGLTSAASYSFDNLDDKYNFAHLAVTFTKVLYHTDDEQDKKIRELFADYPLILERSFEARDMLRANSPDAPVSAAAAMGRMLGIFDLWDLFYIRISGRKIRTKSEFDTFLT